MSARAELAERVAEFVREHDLAQVFGGDVDQSPDKRYYGVLLSIARYLDGFVRVYSERFILVQLQGPYVGGAYDAVYQSEADLFAFLQALFVDHDTHAAYAVPTKARPVAAAAEPRHG